MMDRLAALADIVAPTPVASPVAPGWPASLIVAAAMLIVAAAIAVAWAAWRSRAQRQAAKRLRRVGQEAMQAGACGDVSRLACQAAAYAAQGGLRLAALPVGARRRLDLLRYGPDAQLADLRRILRYFDAALRRRARQRVLGIVVAEHADAQRARRGEGQPVSKGHAA